MATHSSVLAWRIPGTGKPGGLASMGSHRVGHDWSDLAAAAAWINWGSPGGSDGKASACNSGDLGLIPRSGRSSVEGNGNPLQYSCLGKEMATHSSTLAWKIPWTEEPVSYSPWGCKESDTTEQLHFVSFLSIDKLFVKDKLQIVSLIFRINSYGLRMFLLFYSPTSKQQSH